MPRLPNGPKRIMCATPRSRSGTSAARDYTATSEASMSAVPCPAALDTPTGAKPGVRNLAIDSYRGLVMLLMMAEVLELAHVSAAFPGNAFWAFLAWNQ